MTVEADLAAEDIEKRALESETVRKFIEGRSVRKVIVVPNKLVNIAVA